MRKLLNLFTTLSVLTMLFVAPAAVLAQDVPTVEVETTTPTTTSETPTTDTTSTAGVPESGIAPEPSNLLRNAAVFIVGGSIGTAIGFGIVALKKSKLQSNK